MDAISSIVIGIPFGPAPKPPVFTDYNHTAETVL